MILCRHCGRARMTRPRGLCWNCYYAPGVRDLYPTNAKFGRRGLGINNRRRQPPTCPTSAMPGSTEKVLVLMQRAAAGQELWHSEDAPRPERMPLGQVG